MLGGLVGTVPGVPDAAGHETLMMEGTTDTTTRACYRTRPVAEAYAEKYNREIMRAD